MQLAWLAAEIIHISDRYCPSTSVATTHRRLSLAMSYVPPHLRNRQGASASASSAPPPSASPRQPTANGAGSGPAGGAYSSPSRSTPHARSPWSSGPSDRRQDNNSRPRTAGPSLHVFGDSFAGPFKLLSDTSVRTRSFKGASAKVRL